MTGKERITRILNHQPVDRIGVFEHFWSDAVIRWRQEGHLDPAGMPADVFDFDMGEWGPCVTILDMDFVPEVIAEDEDTITVKDQNHATLRRHKKHDATPEHIAFEVTDRESWEKVKPLLKCEDRRIDYVGYRNAKKKAAEEGKYFVCESLNVFECMHPICGHENLLIGMAMDPEWVQDMANTFAKLIVDMHTKLFEQEGLPDGFWFFEDMGFKEHPFMSPAMYRDLIMPAHKMTIDFAHNLGLPVFMHSCGFVEPLLPGMIEAGVNCLEAMEVKAGMDLCRIYKNHGDKLALMGGIDVRVLESNDRAVVDRELETKLPVVMGDHAFILHSDHSIPGSVDFETYKYFVERALEIGTYKDFKE